MSVKYLSESFNNSIMAGLLRGKEQSAYLKSMVGLAESEHIKSITKLAESGHFDAMLKWGEGVQAHSIQKLLNRGLVLNKTQINALKNSGFHIFGSPKHQTVIKASTDRKPAKKGLHRTTLLYIEVCNKLKTMNARDVWNHIKKNQHEWDFVVKVTDEYMEWEAKPRRRDKHGKISTVKRSAFPACLSDLKKKHGKKLFFS